MKEITLKITIDEKGEITHSFKSSCNFLETIALFDLSVMKVKQDHLRQIDILLEAHGSIADELIAKK